MRQIPFVAQLRIAEMAAAITTVVSGGKTLEALQRYDKDPTTELDTMPPVQSFNVHNLKGK